jgi:hypothetical protein
MKKVFGFQIMMLFGLQLFGCASMTRSQLETLTTKCKSGDPGQCYQLFDLVEKTDRQKLISTFESLCPTPGEGAPRFPACAELGRANFLDSKYQAAANVFSKYCKQPGQQLCAFYGSSLFHAGNRTQGWKIVDAYAKSKRLLERCNAGKGDACYEAACMYSLYSMLSGNLKAIEWAASALRLAAERSPDFDWNWTNRDPDMEPLRKLGILENIRSEQNGVRAPASATTKQAPQNSNDGGKILAVDNRSTIDALVSEIKKHEQGMELLKSDFYTTAYTTEPKCDDKKIFLLSDFNLKVPDSVAKFDNIGFPNIASEGHQLRIFLQDKNGSLEVVWNRVVIRSLKFQIHGNCPGLIVVLHGGEFDRAGNAYGVGRLRYRNGKYSILMRNGKTVEEKQ